MIFVQFDIFLIWTNMFLFHKQICPVTTNLLQTTVTSRERKKRRHVSIQKLISFTGLHHSKIPAHCHLLGWNYLTSRPVYYFLFWSTCPKYTSLTSRCFLPCHSTDALFLYLATRDKAWEKRFVGGIDGVCVGDDSNSSISITREEWGGELVNSNGWWLMSWLPTGNCLTKLK